MRLKDGETMVGNDGPGNSESAKRYRQNDIGVETAGGSSWDTMPKNQNPDTLEKSLPNESPESLVKEGEAASRKVGKGSEL